ncbi:MAG: hypothetical protein Q4E75_00950 [bacterium]|nr:hypothetical protein [bacterium]
MKYIEGISSDSGHLAHDQIEWLLSTFHSDSTNKPDLASVRKEELKDSPVSGCRWFINAKKMTTAAGRSKDKRYGIYKNSFSKQRTVFDECGKLPEKSKQLVKKKEEGIVK